MLLILYGATTQMGFESRKYLREQGFEEIIKKNFIPEENRKISSVRYGKRHYFSREEVEACDFVYGVNGFLIGFNREQIIDAVRGRKNSLLSFSMENVDFIRQIKATYGEYVNVIYTYIDHHTLDTMTAALDPITPEEYAHRMKTGNDVKRAFVENRELFDDVVVYGGENSVFDIAFLRRQYALILERMRKKEKILNDKLYVELPYSGNKPYLFVSYAHADAAKVIPILSRLQRSGFRIWYDEGIGTGTNWSNLIAEKLADCEEFLCFVSENATVSTEVVGEIMGARMKKKKMILIRENDAQFAFNHEMYISQFQSVCYDDPSLYEKLESTISSTIMEQ